jgi:CubicO group peptidase (beta-lactamase class C family)
VTGVRVARVLLMRRLRHRHTWPRNRSGDDGAFKRISAPTLIAHVVAARAGPWAPSRRRVQDRRGAAAVASMLVGLSLISLVLGACGHQPNVRVRDAQADALRALSARADRLADQGEFSGAVLVAKDGRVLFSRAYGLADRERRVPNTVGTRFRIGSMSKMFTAVAIMQLVEAGKVKLTAPLGTYMPDYANRAVATRVTIGQLLTHTGGTGNLPLRDVLAHRNELRTLADYMRRYGRRGLDFQPGSRWSYSSYGFVLLGRVIEKVTARSYYDYVQQHVYAPAGMNHSGSLPEDQAVPARSIGYMKLPTTGARVPNTDTLPYRGNSAGGGYSTVEDLGRFAQALLNHRLLSPYRTQLLITGKVPAAPAFGRRYAYGFVDDRDAGGNGWVGHGGAALGMNGDLRIYPDSGYVVAVLANIDPPPAQRISDYPDARLPTRR